MDPKYKRSVLLLPGKVPAMEGHSLAGSSIRYCTERGKLGLVYRFRSLKTGESVEHFQVPNCKEVVL